VRAAERSEPQSEPMVGQARLRNTGQAPAGQARSIPKSEWVGDHGPTDPIR
jgi:hypothetical protein